MDASRELDALVAEKIMGWVPWVDGGAYDTPTGFRLPEEVPHYSTDIAAAWKVVEHLCQQGTWFDIGTTIRGSMEDWKENLNSKDHPRMWGVYFGRRYRALAETAPLAICLAALKAVGVEP